MDSQKLHRKPVVRLALALATVLAGVVAGPSFVAAQGPVPGADNGTGARGTPFRGVALGDTREQIEAALSQIGLRCMTDDEKTLLTQLQIPLLEVGAQIDACRVVRRIDRLPVPIRGRYLYGKEDRHAQCRPSPRVQTLTASPPAERTVTRGRVYAILPADIFVL